MGEKNNLVLVVGAIAAFVLQIALAPAVALRRTPIAKAAH